SSAQSLSATPAGALAPPGSNGLSPPAAMATPPVNLATAPRRPLPLQKAVLMTLQRSELVRTLSGSVTIEPVTTFDPAIADAEFRKAGTRFDPRMSAAYVGSRINQPPSTFFGPGISANTRRDEGDFQASLDKLWSLGTTT